jgi:hypothetical protein
MAWKQIHTSLDSWVVILMESGTKMKLYEPVSQIACVCVSLFLVLNAHIPLYLGLSSSSFSYINSYKFFESPNVLFPVIIDSPFSVTATD